MSIYLGTDLVTLAGPDEGFLKGGRLIAKKTYSFKLSDTNFSSLTLSTTVQKLTFPATDYTAAGQNAPTIFRIGADYDGIVVNRDLYDYNIFGETKITYNYGNNDMSSTIHGIRSSSAITTHCVRYRTFFDETTGCLAETISKNYSNYGPSYGFLYMDASNKYKRDTNARGVHGNCGGDFGADGTYINLKCNGVSVLGHDSYCPVSTLNLINPTKTMIEMT